MTAAPRVEGAVELLERSLGFTRVVLVGVTADHLPLPTPCRGWDLHALLAHMDDGLDAFTEAAAGRVSPTPPTLPVELRVERLRDKACALLGAWSRAAAGQVGIGASRVPADLLVATAALEVAVHGWDVGRVVAGGPPVPEDLAARLLPIAHDLVGPADRGVRFAPALTPPPGATADEQLRAFLGRAG